MAETTLTPMGVVVLALLHEDDMHPYEMLRLLRQRERDRILAVTNGTMYNTVARLETQGLISEVGVDRDGNRPERTTYTLTSEGVDAMRDWVRRELPRIDRATAFRLALAEAHNLPREEVIELLSARREALLEAATRDEETISRALSGGVSGLYLIESQRSCALQRAELSWLDDLLSRLRAGDLEWPTHASRTTETYLSQRKAARQ